MALLILTLTVLVPAVAVAHQRLLRTEPARDSVAGAVPRELRLSFVEPVELAFTRIELVGPDGSLTRLGEARLSSDSVTVLVVPIEGRLQAGSHTVRWATASRDGHPVRGEYSFVIAADAAGLQPETPPETPPAGGEYGAGVTAPGQAAPPADHHADHVRAAADFAADSPGYVAVRWATFLALLGVVGAVAFRLLVLRFVQRRHAAGNEELIADAGRRAASLGLAFAALLIVAGIGRLYAQSLAMHGTDHVLDAGRIATLLRQTVWGWGWLLQAAASLLAVAGFALARRGRLNGWLAAGGAALALALTPALSGHAAAMTGAAGTAAITLDTLHVLAAGGWLGTLLLVIAAGLPAAAGLGPQRRGPAVAMLVRAYSPLALLCAGLLVATGVVAAVLHSTSLGALFGSRYGTVLFIKLGVFALVFATGAYNYLRVKPALGDDAATRRLRGSATFELAIAATVLLVTAVLVATARPYEEDPDSAAALVQPDTSTLTTWSNP